MVKRSHLIFFAVLLFCGASESVPVFADWEADFVQITCNKDLTLFSVRSFALESVNELPIGAAKSAGIYSLDQLIKETPPVCTLGNHSVVLKKSYYHEPHSSGSCGGVNYAVFAVMFDGEKIADITSGNTCGQDSLSEIIISPSLQSNCTVHFNSKWEKGIKRKSPSLICKDLNIPDWFPKQSKPNKEVLKNKGDR
jgi:hypothetical protein